MEFRNQADICQVSMPIADLIPSMALGLLKASLNKAGIKSVVCYEHLFYAKHCGAEAYLNLKRSRQEFLVGEIIFSKAGQGKTLRPLNEYLDWMEKIRLPKGGLNPEEFEAANFWLSNLEKQQALAGDFIQASAERILKFKPRIVAFVSMFQQINSTVALAKRLKQEKNPPLILVGGANCTGELGLAMLDHFSVFDYVFFGEADEIFAEVCAALLKDGCIAAEKLPYGVLSSRSPRPKVPMHRVTKNLEAVPLPDFDDFFATYEKIFPEGNAPFLAEGSRGCWWGEKKPCTFCGLNGLAQTYREKSARRLAEEIEIQTRKYPSARICVFTDSILSRKQIKEFPAAIAKKKIRLNFFAEIKSNLTEEEIRSLAEAGFFQLQPGIESLQDDLLKLMNKGCRAIKQIETLKFCRVYRIFVAWNLLCGFPSEQEKYYAQLAELLPKIMHLPAPFQFKHITFQRFGEYTKNAAWYGLSLRAARIYDFAFADEDFIKRSAYLFESTDENELQSSWDVAQKGDAYRLVGELVRRWKEDYRKNSRQLFMKKFATGIFIHDTRAIAKHTVYRLNGIYADIYRACRSATEKFSLVKNFASIYDEQEIFLVLDYLCAENLMLEIRNEYLALAVEEL